jgi:anti-sigma factor RsiW
MTCREAGPLLNARLDNELDMASSASIDLHLSDCRACAAQYQALQKLHDEIAASALAYAPGIALERKLADQFLLEEKPPFACGTGSMRRCWPSRDRRGSAGHCDSDAASEHGHHQPEFRTTTCGLCRRYQVDVPSSDQHTVKPVSGQDQFSPPVPDLSQEDLSW